MVPTALIFVPFLVAFILATLQYYQIDPRRRVLNTRFGLMAGAAAACIGYPILANTNPGDYAASWIFFALSLFWLAWACYLLRRMPPRDNR